MRNQGKVFLTIHLMPTKYVHSLRICLIYTDKNLTTNQEYQHQIRNYLRNIYHTWNSAGVSGSVGRSTLHHVSLAGAVEQKACVSLRRSMYCVLKLFKHVSADGQLAI